MVAFRTSSCNKTIGQELFRFGVVKLLGCFFNEFPIGMHLSEKFRCCFVVNGGRGAGVVVKGNTQLLEGFLNHLVVFIDDGFWTYSLFFGADRYRYPVFIAPTNKGNIFVLCTQVAHIYISWDIDSSKMSNVYGSVGVGKGSGNCVAFCFERHKV